MQWCTMPDWPMNPKKACGWVGAFRHHFCYEYHAPQIPPPIPKILGLDVHEDGSFGSYNFSQMLANAPLLASKSDPYPYPLSIFFCCIGRGTFF